MKTLLVSFLMVLGTSSAFATEALPAFVGQCQQAAIAKLTAQAQSFGATLDLDSVEVSEVDDRAWNPYKYVWFSAVAHTADNTVVNLEVLTQKGPFKKCF